MRSAKLFGAGLLIMSLVAGAGCTGNSLDDSGGPNVVLEIVSFETPKVTGNVNQGVCQNSGLPCLDNNNCAFDDVCVIPPSTGNCDIQEWSMQLINVPKTELATSSPFNDVVLTSLTLTYNWSPTTLNGSPGVPTTTTIPLGVTIPADGAGDLTFYPIAQNVIDGLTAAGLPAGSSASSAIGIQIQGVVADSDSIGVAAGGTLQIEPCF